MAVLKDFSCTVGTTPVQVYDGLHAMVQPGTAESTGGLKHLRIWNVSPNVTIWLSHGGKAARGAPGSYPLKAGEREEFDGQLIPLEPLSAVAEAEGAALTVELRHAPRVFVTGA